MSLLLVALIVVVAGVLVFVALAPWLRRDRGRGGESEELTSQLDRMENVLRRDPHRDDIVEEYRAALDRWAPLLPPEELERRRAFLREISGQDQGG